MANPHFAQTEQLHSMEMQSVMPSQPFGFAHQRVIYDGKRMRKPITRRVVDFYSDSVNHVMVRTLLCFLSKESKYDEFRPTHMQNIPMKLKLCNLMSILSLKYVDTQARTVHFFVSFLIRSNKN
jgi:hypothetical protein